jgi:hypothetical protein
MKTNQEEPGSLVSLFEKEGLELLAECADILEIADWNMDHMDAATELAAATSNLVGVNCDLMAIMRELSGIANYLEDLGLEAENTAGDLVGFAQALDDLIWDSTDAARTVVRVARELASAHS